MRHAVAAKDAEYAVAVQKLRAQPIHPALGLIQRARDLGDMTVISYAPAAWEWNSKRDGQLLLVRQDVFSGKG
jgi:hypothetical protein